MAAVLGAFVPDTAVRWRGVVTGEVGRRMGVAAEAKKLATRLDRVGAAVGDAEARALRGDEAAARWLANVRAVAYEADGAVDRCRVAARRLKGQEEQQQHHHQALPRLLSSCCDAEEPITADIKSLNRKLQVILKEKHKLQLRPSFSDHCNTPVRTVPRHRKSQKGTRAPNSDIVGARIEDDAHKILGRLTEADGQTNCTIVAIVGPDGLGKTTLAGKVYRSERIRRSFEARSWVRVSRGHTEAGLLSQVVDSFGGYTTGGESVADLGRTLARLVEKKRCLLVLDDVWYGGVWEDVLRRPFERAGRGSKVLVTTRHSSIAREVGAGHVHRVKKLGADDSWLLLRSAARVVDEAAASALNDVGERIVYKCGGVPLAIKVVAGVLRTRATSPYEWAEVHASLAWSVKGLPDDAMKPLYLCYDDLPCHLKQCFLYCSMFPSDLGVDRHVLVQQWISEGFVQIRADASVEEVAEEYYDELVGRHLLQTAKEDEDGGTTRCTMHDMVRALAQLLSLGEDLTGDAHREPVDGDARLVPQRVSFPGRNLTAIPEKILKFQGLRTLLLQRNPLTIEASIFTRLQHLRVLDLSETTVDLVPENLGNLVYLRYLNLSSTRIQAIPESIGNLWNLKFLLLRECKSLHKLPKGIEHLRGLRDLDQAGTVINDAAFRVGHLRSLTSLRCFPVTSKEARAAQDMSGWPLDELKHLSQLRILHITNLEKATGRTEAAEMALAAKKGLRELEMSCSSTVRMIQTTEGIRKIEDIFEEMNPPQCLESLKIANYFGTKFPRWLSLSFLPNLRHLDIIGCNFFQSFPPLGRLPELRSLCIADSSALKDIGTEFMGIDNHHQMVPFPKLQSLHLQGLQNLKTWTDIEVGAFPSLQELQLESCPELQRLPAGLRLVTPLMELRIVDMASLEAVEGMASLKELSVWNAPKLKSISNMLSLEDLNICHCPELQMVYTERLQTVHIFDHELRAMPRWIDTLASKLRSLKFTGAVALLKRCLVDGPDWPVIKDINQVNGYSTRSSYIYYSRSPYIFESNVSTEIDVEDPDDVDQCSVSSSDTGYQEIRGFFDSKVVNTGTTRSKDSVKSNTEESIPKLIRRRLHKLAEVSEEDEVEDGADLALQFPSNPTQVTAAVKKVCPVFTDDGHTKNNVDECSVSSSDTGYQGIRGFFYSKVANTRSKDDMKSNTEESIPRPTCSRLHKLAEVSEEDEVDDGADSPLRFTSKPRATATVEKKFPVFTDDRSNNNNLDLLPKATTQESQAKAIGDHGTHHKTVGRSVFTNRRGSKTGKDVSSDDGTNADRSIKTAASIDHKLLQEGSRAIKVTEFDQYLNLSTDRSKEYISKEGKDVAVDVNNSKDISPVKSKKGKVTFADTTTATVSSPNIVNQNHIKSQISTAVDGSANASPTSENPSGKEEKISAGVTSSSTLSHEGSQTVYATETTKDLDTSVLCSKQQASNQREEATESVCTTSLLSSKQQASNEGEEVTEILCTTSSVSNTVDQKDDSSISSPNHEESQEFGAIENNCDSVSCKLPASLVCSNQQTQKTQTLETVCGDASADTDGSMKKIIGTASRISEKLSNEGAVGSMKDSPAQTASKIPCPATKPTRTMSRAIDITEAAVKPEATTARRFSTNVTTVNDGHTDDDDDVPHQAAPKVYTAIWADTDTDTLRGRFLESMRRYRRMASRRRRRRQRKQGSGNRWSVRPATIAAVLLLVAVAQLLFIIWMYRRFRNQN